MNRAAFSLRPLPIPLELFSIDQFSLRFDMHCPYRWSGLDNHPDESKLINA